MTAILEFDHSALASNDLELTEDFYVNVMGPIIGEVSIGERSPGTTEEIIRRFKTLADGRASRSTEVVYSGATPHFTIHLGQAVIPIRLHQMHMQEPPPEQLRGAPRRAFHVTPEQFERAIQLLRERRVPFEGPVDHPAPSVIARSLYFKDPASNFLELAVTRS
jgi:catechol 2,3-dioxygenase-like lactoylglutathione lyase family enzyme